MAPLLMSCTCVVKACARERVCNLVLNFLYFMQALLFISELFICR
jgi:hypothetical protein